MNKLLIGVVALSVAERRRARRGDLADAAKASGDADSG